MKASEGFSCVALRTRGKPRVSIWEGGARNRAAHREHDECEERSGVPDLGHQEELQLQAMVAPILRREVAQRLPNNSVEPTPEEWRGSR